MPEKSPGQRMSQEIREQPAAVNRLIDGELEHVWEMAGRWRRKRPVSIFIAARGTSDHVALYGKYLFEITNGIPMGLAAPSVASVYHAKVNVKGALFIGISQSGEAADVMGVLEQARAAGADTLAITNEADSPICQAADETILLRAGREKAVAATKTYTTSMAALLMLSAAIARSGELRDELRRVPELMANALRREAEIHTGVERFRYLTDCVVLGRGYNLCTAYELSLKLRETSYVRAQPFASPDFVHGPIAIVEAGYPVIAIANRGAVLESVKEVIAHVRRRGAEAVVIGNAPDALAMADVAFPTNPDIDVPEVISPFASAVAGQVFACALSVLKGNDPDHPRGLKKVTITR